MSLAIFYREPFGMGVSLSSKVGSSSVVLAAVAGWALVLAPVPGLAQPESERADSELEAPDEQSESVSPADAEQSAESKQKANTGEQSTQQSRVGIRDSFLFRPEFRTDIPLLVGGGLQLEFPGRFRANVSVGSLPTGYIRVGNLVTTSVFQDYNDTQAQLVEDAVERSLVWRFHAGMRPLAGKGLYVAGGYTLATLGGRSTSGRTVDDLVEADIPNSVEQNFDVGATSTLHMLDIEVGWEFFRRSLWNLRVGFGWSFTIAASASLESQYRGRGPEEQEAIEALESQGEDHLVESYKKFVHPPYLGVSAGFGF